MAKVYTVRAFWDDEAKVWCATSENFIGIATEADSLDKLYAKLRDMVPEILEENGYISRHPDGIPYQLLTDCIASRECH